MNSAPHVEGQLLIMTSSLLLLQDTVDNDVKMLMNKPHTIIVYFTLFCVFFNHNTVEIFTGFNITKIRIRRREKKEEKK